MRDRSVLSLKVPMRFCWRLLTEDGIQRSGAHERLLEADFAEGDAEYAIDRLLSQGYLYDIDSQLFVTENEDFEQVK